MKKKYMKDSLKLAGGGIAMGIGAGLATEAGSTYGATAIGGVARGMKPVGSMIGAGMVMDSLSGFQKKTKKALKKY